MLQYVGVCVCVSAGGCRTEKVKAAEGGAGDDLR